MTSQHERRALMSLAANLAWPMLWGLAAAAGFYALVLRGALQSEFTHRYFAGHPVCYFETVLFFVGMAALVMKLINTVGQYLSMGKVELQSSPDHSQPIDECGMLLDAMAELPPRHQSSYLGRRLRDALEFVERHGTSSGLDDQLRYLADVDAGRQQDGYSLVRIIIWATPMLGFLGTVVGITQALGDLDPAELARSIQTAMDKLLGGLYVAFDTTALALSLSMVLMFIQFLVDRLETQLLSAVDERVARDLSGRFEDLGSGRDPHVASVERMSHAVIESSQTLVAHQTQLWQATIEEAQEHWRRAATEAAQQTQTALTGALDTSLNGFANRLIQAEQQSAEMATRRWEQWQTVLSDNARLLHAQQVELGKQGETMSRVLEATGNVVQLEAALNENLRALRAAGQFDEVMAGLSAAIHLLSARLGQTPSEAPRVQLQPGERQGRAA